MSSKHVVFLDRDGIINVDTGYTYKVSDLELFPDVGESLLKLQKNIFRIIVVTNQSGVARGMFSLNDVYLFHSAMQAQLSKHFGVMIDRFLVCPHYEGGTVEPYNIACRCRKPGAQMISQTLRDFNLEPQYSFMIGDRASDIEAGKNAGTCNILVERNQDKTLTSCGEDYRAKNLQDAVDFILKH